MNIGFDGLAFQKNPNGIGKYFLSLIELLVKNYPAYRFFCYSNKDIILPESLKKKVNLRIDSESSTHLKSNVWLKIKASKQIKRDSLDFYISSAGIFPHLQKCIKKVALVHDLNYLIVPKTMGSTQWLMHFLYLKRDVKKADFVVTNSKGTAKKILHYFKKRCDTIINPTTGTIFKQLSKKEIQLALDKYTLTFSYFLTVGALEPRKNLIKTINNFLALIRQNQHKEHKLVIVGGGGWKNSEILNLIESEKEHIVRLGYVPEEDLPGLYNGATAFLFPSIYEGFGMPVREAVYCGCPVITSNLEELIESSKGVACYINPENDLDYLSAMKKMLEKDFKVSKVEKDENESMIQSFIDIFKEDKY